MVRVAKEETKASPKAAPKRRGRPPRAKAPEIDNELKLPGMDLEPQSAGEETSTEKEPVKVRRRGRPPKSASKQEKTPVRKAKRVVEPEPLSEEEPDDIQLETEETEESLPLPAEETENQAQRTYVSSSRESFQHPKPKHTYAYLAEQNLMDLRRIGKECNVAGLTALRKDDLIISILRAQAESMNYRFGGGTLEILPEGFGFLRPKGMLPTENDVYLSSSQIRRFGLRNGDVIWGLIRPPREQEHYEALLRVETVNFSDPESSRQRPLFSQLTPIFPNVRINLDSGPGDWATRLVDMFAPIGLGQRALIVSPPKAGKTTLLKRIAKAITQNSPDIILMALLIDERPEEVTDISRSIEGEVIASTFDRPAEEHIRVANLALEKAKRLVEARRDVVILLDSITRLARASNLTVPPSGRTLSGGLDSSGLYFPKRFFGAARNFEEGGSLTIVGTALTETGSRMDDVIYEEFKGTGNMELHLSRKLSEQRIFPAIDITKSGTRREELLIPEEELTRLWVLRKRIVGVDEAGALNLILDKLKQTKNNHEFLMSIKLN
ncbi:MAG: transcription termination factor Rho [Fretibacterium sp.]|nr:transcription termination factor Rho [Fretibacterium sp.]